MNHAEKTVALPLELPLQAEGQVVGLEPDGSVQVVSHGRRWHCPRAASCLLTPQLHDQVLLCRATDQMWLLAILVRAEPQQAAQLHCEGELTISASRKLNLSSPALQLNAERGDCDIKQLNYRGESASVWISLSRLFGKRCESVWESVSQISQRLMRRTHDIEQVRAGQLDIKTSQLTRLHAPTTFISSKTLTRIDGKQIHMG